MPYVCLLFDYSLLENSQVFSDWPQLFFESAQLHDLARQLLLLPLAILEPALHLGYPVLVLGDVSFNFGELLEVLYRQVEPLLELASVLAVLLVGLAHLI